MKRVHTGLIVLLVATLGLWGCSQGNSKSAANNERIKTLEAKCAKLEEDYRAVASARDQARRKAAQIEADQEKEKEAFAKEKVQLQVELEKQQLIAKERDTIKSDLATRTLERDTYQTHLDELRRGMKSLLSQVDAVMPERQEPAVEVVPIPKL